MPYASGALFLMNIEKKKYVVKNGNLERSIIMERRSWDYVWYASYYNSTNGKLKGNWKDIGWYTTWPHCKRAFSRLTNKEWKLISNENKKHKSLS